MPGRRHCTRVPQEESDHLPAGVGAARVRVGATDAAARPSMSPAVQDPLLKDLRAGRVEMDRAGVGHPARRIAPRHHLGQRRLLPCCATTWSLLTGLTVRSASPWKTIVGTVGP